MCVNLLGMRHFLVKILVCCLLLSSCTNPGGEGKTELLAIQKVFLRDNPSETGKETVALRLRQSLKDLGETSLPESQVSLNGVYYQGPWIKVEAGQGQQGWVPAWALESPAPGWLLQKRIQAYFGRSILEKCEAIKENLANPENEKDLADAWRQSVQLRDTMLQILSANAAIRPGLQMDWLGEVLPGFIFQQMGARPTLFADFGFWSRQALKTNGQQDDDFFKTCLVAYPADSIESVAASWEFPISETEALSNLGKGKHLEILLLLQKTMPANALFAPELDALREKVINDIFEEKRYWQSAEKILEELDELLASNPPVLKPAEKEAMEIRRRMFEMPAENGVSVNLRAGESAVSGD